MMSFDQKTFEKSDLNFDTILLNNYRKMYIFFETITKTEAILFALLMLDKSTVDKGFLK